MTASVDLARAVVVALRAAGVGHVVICPGSRSAPLAYALQDAERRSGPRLHVRHDERVAAFTALGMASTGTPSAVVTTSGTAVANLHPAVLEAHHAGRPLILLTADRPRPLRGTWANQTSALQEHLFGPAVRARLDLEADLWPAVDIRRLIGCLRAAVGAHGSRPGPVHVNVGFTEPLVPQHGPPAPTDDEAPLPPRDRDHGTARRDPVLLAPGGRTVVVAGAQTVASGPASGAAARGLAAATGWPLLAEPSSGARHGDPVIGPYRLLLENQSLAAAIERVVVFGRPTLSRPVTRLLGRSDVEVVLVSPWSDWPEPGRTVARATAVQGPPPGLDAAATWSLGWTTAARRAQDALDVVLDRQDRPSGPVLARAVARCLAPGQTLVAAASNPIRDLDLAAGTFADGTAVLANRGLSGIDGTLSTASGRALAGRGAVRALVGDLAFLHDLNALLRAPREQSPDLQVLVLNDDGGGIFSLLEYGEVAERDAASAADFERLFGTPHRADLAALCRGLGVPHHRVSRVEELDPLLAEPVRGTSVVEVPADRSGLRRLHAELRTAVTRSGPPPVG